MNKIRRGSRGFYLCGWIGGLCLCGLALLGCKDNASTAPTQRRASKAAPDVDEHTALEQLARKQKASATRDREWLSHSWIQHVLKQPGAIPAFFSKDEARRDDLSALWGNQWHKAAAVARDPKTLIPGHAAIRARLFLRMARFYRASYRLASDLNLGRLTKRAERASKNAGKLFFYYLGRQQCMSQYRLKAKASLTKALGQVPANRKERVQLWLALCDPAHPQPNTPALLKQIKELRFAGDPGASAEVLLLKQMFGAQIDTPKVTGEDPRAQLWQALSVSDTALPLKASSILRGVAESEEIREGEITASLDYFDPGLLWSLSRYYARRAMAALTFTPASDRYVPFYRAWAHHYLGQTNKAMTALAQFLKQPPTTIDLAYLLFSRRLSIAALVAEAKVLQVGWGTREPQQRKAKYQALAKELTYPAVAQLHLDMLLASQKKAVRRSAYIGLLVGALLATDATKELFVMLTKATEAKLPKQASEEQKAQAQGRANAANALLKWQIHRTAVRPLYIAAIRGALAHDDVERAVRWAEELHRKDTPYELGDRNEAYQFILTTRAYILSGKMGIATLYLTKSKNVYPALTQIWSLLRILRIYRGTEGGSIIVMPKGG